jgi:hypothetical protein
MKPIYLTGLGYGLAETADEIREREPEAADYLLKVARLLWEYVERHGDAEW